MKTVALVFIAFVAAAVPPVVQAPRIVIDGEFRDWTNVPVALRDGGDAPASVVDFGDVRVAADGRHVFMNVAMGREVNMTTLQGTLFVVVDLDGDPTTGESAHGLDGADLLIECSPVPPNPQAPAQTGVVVRRLPKPATGPAAGVWSAINFQYAPRHAGEVYEWRLDRTAARNIRFKLVFSSGGKTMDQTDVITFGLPPQSTETTPTRGTGELDPIARTSDASFRAAVWNVGGMLHFGAEAVARVVAAIDPDVLILDEVWSALSAEMIAARLPAASRHSKAPWQAVIGSSGERHALAVRGRAEVDTLRIDYPQEGLTALTGLDASDRVAYLERGVGASVVVVQIGGRRLLVTPVDFTCCGPPESQAEAQRVLEADAINRALAIARERVKPDAILIGGDVNLVGTRHPLEILRRGLDRDRAPLAIVDALRLNDISKDTWRPPGGGGRFPPGRLDWLLYSGSSLAVVNSFVFDAADLSPRWLTHYKLEAADSLTSDHLPIVADFRWR